MPSTHLSLHYHLVFSTKNRLPMITKDWRVNLHAYLGSIVKGINGVPLAIGGIEDHVHLLVGLRATHRLDYVLRDIKADSSSWVHNVVGRKNVRVAGGISWCHSQSFPNRASEELYLESGGAPSAPDFSGGIP